MENLEKEIKALEEMDKEAEVVGASVSEPPEPPEEPEIIYQFKEPYVFDDKEYKEIDLSKITQFSTRDMEFLDKAYLQTRRVPEKKWFDTTFMKLIAMQATGLPVEFFNSMRAKEFMEIEARIRLYFLFK